MNIFLILAPLLLGTWQIHQFREKRAKVREKMLVYGLYAISFGLSIMSAKNWITPDILRPWIVCYQSLNRVFGLG